MENLKQLLKLVGMEVSFVDKPANKEKFAMTKADDGIKEEIDIETMLDSASKVLAKAFDDFKNGVIKKDVLEIALDLGKTHLTKANFDRVLQEKQEKAFKSVDEMIKNLDGELEKLLKADEKPELKVEEKPDKVEESLKAMGDKINELFSLVTKGTEVKKAEKSEKENDKIIKELEDLKIKNKELNKKLELEKAKPSEMSKADKKPADKKDKEEPQGRYVSVIGNFNDYLDEILKQD